MGPQPFELVRGGPQGSEEVDVALMVHGHNQITNDVRYMPAGPSVTTGTSTESDLQYPAPFAGTMQNARVHGSLNTASGATLFTIRKNGISSGLTVSVAAGVTGDFDLPGTATLAKNDLHSVECDMSASAPAPTMRANLSFEITPT